MVMPYTTSSSSLVASSALFPSATLHTAPASPLPQPNLDAPAAHLTMDSRSGRHRANQGLPMPLSKRYLHPRAFSRPLLLLPPHIQGNARVQSHSSDPKPEPLPPSTWTANRWHINAALPQTTAAAPIIIGTIVGPLPTNVPTDTPPPVPAPMQSTTPIVTPSAPANTLPLSSVNTSGSTSASVTSTAAASTTSPPVPVPPTLGQPTDANGNTADSSSSDDGGRSLLRLLELILIPAIAVAVLGLILLGAWRLWGPNGRHRKRRSGAGASNTNGGGGWWSGRRQKRRGGRKGSRDLDNAVLAFVGGSGRLRRDGSLIYGPAYEAGTGTRIGDDERKREVYGTAGSAIAHEMYGQRYPSLERPERVGHEDDEDDESKELGYLGSTPTKASTQPYGPGGVLPPGRFKWPDLSINSLRQSIRRPGGAGQQNPPHDFRRHIVDLGAHQQQREDGMGYAYHYQNPYDPPREDSSGGGGRGRPGGGAGPREGFRHWGVSLQETYYDEAVVFPYTDYPENEWEWMKENGSLPLNGKVVQGDTFRPSCAGIVSRNHSEASAYPPSRAMSKRSAGTVKGLGLEDGGKGRRLLEEVKKEKTWMDSIRGILTGGASGGVGEGGTGDREALVGRGDEYADEEEEMRPRALNRSATMRTKPSRDDPETSLFVNGRGHGAVLGYYGEDDEHPKSPVSTSNRYTSPTSKAGSHQHQRLTAPSKRRAHKRGDSDAYVVDTEIVEIEGQRTPTQALFRGGKLDEGAMASFGAAMHDLDGGDNLPETPDRRPRLSNVRHSYVPLRDKEEEEAKRDRYTPKPARTRKSRSRDGSASPSRYARSRSGTTSSESVPMTIRRVESSGDDHGQSSTPQKSPTSMAKEVLPRSPPQITSPPLENQIFFATTPNKAIPQTPIKGHSRSSRKARSTNYMPPSSPSMRKPPSLSSRSGTPGRKTPTTSRSSAANSKPVPPPLIPPAGSSSTAHNRSDITFTSRLTGESTGTAARVQVAQNLALDKLGRIVESSWNVREQAIGEEGMRALSPTAFGRKVQG